MSDSSKQRVKFFIIVGILSIILISIIGYFTPDIVESSICRRERDLKDVYLKGLIKGKFIDQKNHSAEVLLIHDESDIEWQLILNGDISKLYTYAAVGDSIFKPVSSLKIELSKKGNRSDFRVD